MGESLLSPWIRKVFPPGNRSGSPAGPTEFTKGSVHFGNPAALAGGSPPSL